MTKPNNYVVYHLHSMLSNGTTNIDSITNFRDYVSAAAACGMNALGFSEHGNLFEWVHKKEAIEAAGMKYIHGVEAYLTESLDQKVRDNYHCVLIARNFAGKEELNKLMSIASNRLERPELGLHDDGHFYYTPRISFDELFATSENIIISSACLASALNSDLSSAKEKFLSFMLANKDRCFLEIQHHNCDEQREYNKWLYKLHQQFGLRLITGTDTHALNNEHLAGRSLMQKSKGVFFENESDWDLVFKTLDELIDAYQKQGSLPIDVVYEAINNTNALADMVEPFELDRSHKYPVLYENSESVFKQKVNEGVKRRGISKRKNKSEYYDRIHEEYDTYVHNGAIDFMLLEEDYKSEMRRRGIKFGYSRGSVSGSIIAYLLGITEIDSVKYKLNFERFMNKERVSLADIDTDWYSDDRETVRNYLYDKEGLYCCDIVTFNTIALKGAIKNVCRGFHRENMDHLPQRVKDELKKYQKDSALDGGPIKEISDSIIIKEYHKHSIHKEIPYDYLTKADEIIALAEYDECAARAQYPEVFKYVDLVLGVIVSVGNHPSACVVSPYPVDEWFGTFTTSTDNYPISVINMKEIDSLNFVKLDILGLDNIGLIYKTCDLVGIPFATPDNVPPDDQAVWDSIREDTTTIFQWESNSATAYLKQLLSPDTVNKIKEKNPDVTYMDLLSIGNGAIRPAGESYRDKLSRGIYQDNGHEALNKFLAPTLGYLVYQEQIIEFLHSFCGYTMGEADIVRRGFAKKTGTDQFIPKIKAGFTKTMKEKYGVSEEESETLIENFIQVIKDASDYLFSKNHADPYSWIGYICGYLRYYYPLEFITTALNIFADKEDKSVAIIAYAQKHGIKISPIKFRHSIANYNFNKETNEIYKGLSSIKFMNFTIAEELYALRDKNYDSFVDLLYDLQKTSLNSRQLKILIELDFFSEFGDANYLLKQAELFDQLSGKSQIKKEKAEELSIPAELLKRYAEKETDKLYKGINMPLLLREYLSSVSYKPRCVKEKVAAQAEYLGYIDVADKRYAGYAAVVSVNTKYAPKLQLYSLKNGTNIECRIDKRTFAKCPLTAGDIVLIQYTKNKPKMRRTEEGKFEEIPDTKELWITQYEIQNE